MLRKLSLVAIAAASLGAAALAPTSASAWDGWHGGWHHGWGFGPRVYVGGPALQLWLRRLLCAATGPDPLGTPLAAGEPLLLTKTALSRISKAPALAPGLYASWRAGFHAIFTRKPRNRPLRRQPFRLP